MKRTTALATAGALVLTVAGGVSTLALTTRQQPLNPPVVLQYVDQAGNPVPAPGADQARQAPEAVMPGPDVAQPEAVPPVDAYPSTPPTYMEEVYVEPEEELEESEYEETGYEAGRQSEYQNDSSSLYEDHHDIA